MIYDKIIYENEDIDATNALHARTAPSASTCVQSTHGKRPRQPSSLTENITYMASNPSLPEHVRHELNKYDKDDIRQNIWTSEPSKVTSKRHRAEDALRASNLSSFTAPSKRDRDIWAQEYPLVKQKAMAIAKNRSPNSPSSFFRPFTNSETEAAQFSPEARQLMVRFTNFPAPDLNLPPALSLKDRQDIWKDLASFTGYSMVKNGCLPNFITCPPRMEFENYRLDDTSLIAARDIIKEYIKNGIIHEASKNDVWASSPIFVIEKTSGGHRLIIDLRAINVFVQSPTFKMENIATVKRLSQGMKYASTLDISSAFHHVALASEIKKFLGISMDRQYYVFDRLPFGFATSPYGWNVIISEAISIIRSTGVTLSFYADDIIVFGSTLAQAKRARAVVVASLHNLGIVVNLKKGTPIPDTKVQFIGFEVDLKHSQLKVLPVKIKSIRKAAYRLNKKGKFSPVKVRDIMHFAGVVQSISPACPPARMLVRSLYNDIAKKRPLQYTRLSKQSRADLGFWSRFHESYSFAPLHEWPSQGDHSELVTDASGIGWGAVWLIILPDGSRKILKARGFWIASEKHLPISCLETLAIWRAMQALPPDCLPLLKGRILHIKCDNTATVYAIQNTVGRATSINNILRHILPWLWHLQIPFDIFHVISKENIADQLSREIDSEDYCLRKELFFRSQLHFHVTVTIDRFASEHNHLVPRFNSRWLCPNTEAVNAFLQNWKKDINWVNAPFTLLPETLALIRHQGAHSLVVAPVWPNSPWWPELISLASDIMILPRNTPLFIAGHGGTNTLSPPPTWDVIVAHIPPRGANAKTTTIPQKVKSILQNLFYP